MLSTMWPEKTACSLFRSRVRGQTSRLQHHGADPVQHFSVSMVTVDKHRDFSGALLKSGTNTISTPTTPLASSLAPSAVTKAPVVSGRKSLRQQQHLSAKLKKNTALRFLPHSCCPPKMEAKKRQEMSSVSFFCSCFFFWYKHCLHTVCMLTISNKSKSKLVNVK